MGGTKTTSVHSKTSQIKKNRKKQIRKPTAPTLAEDGTELEKVDIRIKKQHYIKYVTIEDLETIQDQSNNKNVLSVYEKLHFAFWKRRLNIIENCMFKFRRHFDMFISELIKRRDAEKILIFFDIILQNCPGAFAILNLHKISGTTIKHTYIARLFQEKIVGIIRSATFPIILDKIPLIVRQNHDISTFKLMTRVASYFMWEFFSTQIFMDYYIPPFEIYVIAMKQCEYFANYVAILRFVYRIYRQELTLDIYENLGVCMAQKFLTQESVVFNYDVIEQLRNVVMDFIR